MLVVYVRPSLRGAKADNGAWLALARNQSCDVISRCNVGVLVDGCETERRLRRKYLGAALRACIIRTLPVAVAASQPSRFRARRRQL